MKKLLLRLLVSLVVGGGLLYLASLRISFAGVWESFSQVRWSRVVLPYFACMLLQHFFRTWRWGQLLAPIQPVPFRRLLPIASVGFFAIMALPLRMGELVRPYLIADPPRLRMSHGLGTMAVERVFDGLVLSLAAFAAIATHRASGIGGCPCGRTEVPTWVLSAGIAALGLFVAALVVLVMTLWQRDRAVAICRRFFALFSARLADRAAGVAAGIVDGFRVLPDWRRLALFIAATLAYWALNALALWALAVGFELPIGLEGAVGMMALVGIGIIIPAGPGFIGNYELFAVGAIGMYVPEVLFENAVAGFVVASHAANVLWYLAVGAISVFSPHVSFTRVLKASKKRSE